MVGGLSPPTRGSQATPDGPKAAIRSIPAHAGEPGLPKLPDKETGVYPRPRGGARKGRYDPRAGEGLSPPTRGSQRRIPLLPVSSRSIPAHAGEPTPISGGKAPASVYPRPRGGAGSGRGLGVSDWGLSPPTRGSRDRNGVKGVRRGSIPAHAGSRAVAA